MKKESWSAFGEKLLQAAIMQTVSELLKGLTRAILNW